MTAKSDESESAVEKNFKPLEDFVRDYLAAYKEHLSSKELDAAHLPQFYKGFPYLAEIYKFPNGAVCALFRKSNRSRYSSQDSDFDTVMARFRNMDFDFMQVFPPYTTFTGDEAARLAALDADRDMKVSRRLELLTAAGKHISDIHSDIQSVVELNPWLDQQTAEQKIKLDRAKELIKQLYEEVEISKEERFSDYTRQLSELMAFEKGDIDEVAGELEVEMESALEVMDGRIAALEESLGTHDHGSEDITKVATDLAELSRSLREINLRLKSVESGDSTEDLQKDVSKALAGSKDMSRRLMDLEKEIKTIKSDITETKETVTRDSKRAFNLNERVTDLERSTANMKKDSGKDSRAEVKALEGRMNVMERDLRNQVRTMVLAEMERSRPVVIESQPVTEVIETLPGTGAQVKKTTKKTTTKRTTRSK